MSQESFFDPEEVAALKEAFFAQAKEMLEEFAAQVLALESTESPEVPLAALERLVHTLKGDSMALEFSELSRLAHRLEDHLGSLRGKGRIGRAAADLLLACGDRMSALLAAYGSDAPESVPNVDDLCAKIAPGDGTRYRLTVWFARSCEMHSAGAFLVRRRLERVARLLSSSPDPESEAIELTKKWRVDVESASDDKAIRAAARVPNVTSRVVVEKLPGAAAAPSGAGDTSADDAERSSAADPEQPRAPASTPSHGGAGSEQLRVEVDKIDRIMNLVGELVIGRSMVAQALTELGAAAAAPSAVEDRLGEANAVLERTLSELQAAVLNIRMVPVEHVFRRFPRLVRDLSHVSGKQIDLEIEGGATELDKSIVDALGEPLLHLVRNAVDHGLEGPEERRSRGKPPAGRLRLKAYYEGNQAHVVVEDDGRGIDVDRVAERAVEAGLFDESQIESLSPGEILNALYHPGFSTASSVTDVSGRGIGMDVVRESIERLKGVIELSTVPGQGTRFLVRLPLTLAILRAVLVEVGTKAFALPLTGVLEIVRPNSEEHASVLGKGVLTWRDHVVPLVSLREVLGLGPVSGPAADGSTRPFVLVVGEAERRLGLLADRLIGEQELVVKPIEDPFVRSPAVAGASILGNGRVVLILHVRGLVGEGNSRATKVEVLP